MHKEKTTIALLSADTLLGRTLALLLEGLGYEVQILEAWSTTSFGELLEGVDLILLAPRLSEASCETLLGTIRSASKRQTIPILKLSAVGEMVSDKADSSIVPWPTSIEFLQRKLEAALQAAMDAPSTLADAREPSAKT